MRYRNEAHAQCSTHVFDAQFEAEVEQSGGQLGIEDPLQVHLVAGEHAGGHLGLPPAHDPGEEQGTRGATKRKKPAAQTKRSRPH